MAGKPSDLSCDVIRTENSRRLVLLLTLLKKDEK